MNWVILSGRVSSKPVVTWSKKQQGKACNMREAMFQICVIRYWNDRNNIASKEERTFDYFDCLVTGKNVDFVESTLFRGASVVVDGKMRSKKMRTEEGVETSSVEIVADRVELTETKEQNSLLKSMLQENS